MSNIIQSPQSKALSNDFYYDLIAFLMQSKRHILALATEYGLTGPQALSLLTMKNHQQPSMSELCKRYDCDASNITGIIDGLEQKGLVSRQPHPNDRRVKLIHVEPAGHALQKQLIARIADLGPQLFAGLDCAETHQFASLIQKIQIAN